jgi:surface antigen
MATQKYIGAKARVAAVTSLILTLAAISAMASTHAGSAKPNFETLPAYRPGTTFVYSDGTWETVAAVTPHAVIWRDHRGYTSSRTPDFTRRPISYQTRTRQGTRTFGPRENIIAGGQQSIWPLKIGKKASFTERGTWIDKKDGSEHAYRTHWSCEVAGKKRVAVPAGEFDTWKITCTRYNVSRRTSRSQPREVKTWYYAPQIGHYVLVTRKYFYDKPARRQEMLAVLPSKEILPTHARRKMENTFQTAMEYKVSGAPDLWSLSSKAVSGGTTPYGTFKLEDGTFCRRYVQELKLSDDRQIYYGLACRDRKGKWVIPRR